MDNEYTSGFIAGQNSRDGYGDGFGGSGYGMGYMFMILILALFWGGGNGFGGRGYDNGAETRGEVQRGFDTRTVVSKLDGITNGLCDGFYAQNNTMLQGFATLGSQIAENRFAAQQCCCETNRNIDAVRYDAQKNTCDITTAIHAEGEATRALINANQMQDLRGKIEARDRQLMTAQFQLSQQAQNAYLVDQIRPCARPDYITCSPYAANTCGGCGAGIWA